MPKLGETSSLFHSHCLVNSIADFYPEADPMNQAMMTTLQEAAQPDLEDYIQHFVQEGAEYDEPVNLDKSKETPRPPIELKSLPSGLKYAFLNNDCQTP